MTRAFVKDLIPCVRFSPLLSDPTQKWVFSVPCTINPIWDSLWPLSELRLWLCYNAWRVKNFGLVFKAEHMQIVHFKLNDAELHNDFERSGIFTSLNLLWLRLQRWKIMDTCVCVVNVYFKAWFRAGEWCMSWTFYILVLLRSWFVRVDTKPWPTASVHQSRSLSERWGPWGQRRHQPVCADVSVLYVWARGSVCYGVVDCIIGMRAGGTRPNENTHTHTLLPVEGTVWW